jgi:hypothetical protein
MTHRFARSALALLALAGPLAVAAAAESNEQMQQRQMAAAQVPVDRLDEPLRSKISDILQKPTLFIRGPVEAFPCKPGVYHWLLENPHWGFRAWKALGSECAAVERKEDGSFVGKDNRNGEMRWQNILNEPGRRIWYAEGSGKALALTPTIAVRALVLLRYQEVRGIDGKVGIRHRAELFAQFESKSASLIAKATSMTAETMAKRTIEQVELFFSGMAWYISEHPEWTILLLQQGVKERPMEQGQADLLRRELSSSPKVPALPGKS